MAAAGAWRCPVVMGVGGGEWRRCRRSRVWFGGSGAGVDAAQLEREREQKR